jgi:hypothetical protein
MNRLFKHMRRVPLISQVLSRNEREASTLMERRIDNAEVPHQPRYSLCAAFAQPVLSVSPDFPSAIFPETTSLFFDALLSGSCRQPARLAPLRRRPARIQ